VQKEFAMNEFIPCKLIPLVCTDPAVEDVGRQEEEAEADLKRQRLDLRRDLNAIEYNRREEAAQSAQTMPTLIGNEIPPEEVELTPFDNVHEKSVKMKTLIEDDFDHPTPPGDPLISALEALDNCPTVIPFTENDKARMLRARRLYLFLRDALMNQFEPLFNGSPRMSPMGKIIVRQGHRGRSPRRHIDPIRPDEVDPFGADAPAPPRPGPASAGGPNDPEAPPRAAADIEDLVEVLAREHEREGVPDPSPLEGF